MFVPQYDSCSSNCFTLHRLESGKVLVVDRQRTVGGDGGEEVEDSGGWWWISGQTKANVKGKGSCA